MHLQQTGYFLVQRGKKVSVDSVKSKKKCVPSPISSFISKVCAMHFASQDHPVLRENVTKIANLLLFGPLSWPTYETLVRSGSNESISEVFLSPGGDLNRHQRD